MTGMPMKSVPDRRNPGRWEVPSIQQRLDDEIVCSLRRRRVNTRKDGDLIFITNNRVLVENIRPMPTIFCVQRKGEKKIVTEDDLVKANLASFGDDIGKTTNYITSMYDVQARFEPGSPEYDMLTYRIRCGQLYQQNAIDKVKGISCRPMPKYWYDYRAANALPENPTKEDIEKRDFNLRILADKKPYFMRYIYPAVMKDYNTYTKNVEDKCAILFGKSIDELFALDSSETTDEHRRFMHYYRSKMPVGMNECLMNRICRRFEDRFGIKLRRKISDNPFDYSILKGNIPYKNHQRAAIAKLYAEHTKRMKEHYAKESSAAWAYSRDGWSERLESRSAFVKEFSRNAIALCSNSRQLCEIALDVCYTREGSKHFAWDICYADILLNLLEKNDCMISYPVADPDGDIEFRGEKYSMRQKRCDEWSMLF